MMTHDQILAEAQAARQAHDAMIEERRSRMMTQSFDALARQAQALESAHARLIEETGGDPMAPVKPIEVELHELDPAALIGAVCAFHPDRDQPGFLATMEARFRAAAIEQFPGSTPEGAFLLKMRELAEGLKQAAAEPPLPAGEEAGVTAGVREIEVDGAAYLLAPSDAAKLTGAFLLALNGQETAIVLASGEALTVTPANALSIATQLAGAST